jgi:ubiquinone/menaquinone biosynthesis C-methylase UbiE
MAQEQGNAIGGKGAQEQGNAIGGKGAREQGKGTQPSPLTTPMPWDLVANAYEADNMPVLEPFARHALELLGPATGARVIDVACGPGTLTVLAAQRGCRVDALDFAPLMIERLQARLRADGITNVTPRVGDGQALPYEPASFAAGFSMFGLMFFPDRAKGFAELRRVLAPGGRALVSSWTPMDDQPAISVMFESVFRALGQPRPKVPTVLGTADDCHAEMSAAFADVEVHRVANTSEAPSVRELWASVTRAMAPIALMHKMVGAEVWAAKVDPVVIPALEGVLGTGKVRLEMTALLSVGTAS